MSSGIKAGLIGAGAGIVLGLLGLIPTIGCCFNIVALLVYVVAGVLAALWIPPIRSVGAGAGQGAIAGLITGIGSSVVGVISSVIYGLTGGTGRAVIDPTLLDQLAEQGVELDPEMLSFMTGVGGGLLGGAMCCVFGLALGVGLGAAGGAIFAAVKKD